MGAPLAKVPPGGRALRLFDLDEGGLDCGTEVRAAVATGRIDLLHWVEGGPVLVHWKRHAIDASEAQVRAAEHRGQAAVYAWAADRATGHPVVEVVFMLARASASGGG